jgi:hypothetical protein
MTGVDLPQSCEECRELVTAEPRSERASEHLAACAECQAYHEELLAFDADIARALAVPVPRIDLSGLPAGANAATFLDGAPGTDDETDLEWMKPPRRREIPGSAWYALAAPVVLGALFSMRYLGEELPAEPLSEQVLAHIQHEAGSLVVSDRGVGGERLARVVPADVARLGPETGLVTYAQSCVINGHSVPHLVVQGGHGPVTILLMPHERVSAAEEIGNGVLRGVILPVGEGSIAIVGEHPTDLERVRETMKNSVTWQT